MASWQECTCLPLLWKPVKDGSVVLLSKISGWDTWSVVEAVCTQTDFHCTEWFHLTSSFRLRSCLFTPDSTLKASRMAFLFYFNLIQCTFISVVGELTAGFVLPSIYICLLSLAYKQRCVPQGFMNSHKEELHLSPSHLSLCERTV